MAFALKLAKRGALLALAAGAVLTIVALLQPLPERLAARDSTVVEFRDGTPAHVFLSSDGKWRIAAPEREVDPAYVAALLRLEDRRFHQHLGVDPAAAARALFTNLHRGRVVSGASTITMQLVRMLEPRPRTLRSKLIETVRAYSLELHLSKQQILESYLRFVPFGGNVEGVEAASLVYFGHSARALTQAEIATLLAVPQDPNDRAPSELNGDRLRAARDQIAHRLTALGAWSERVASEVADQPVPRGRSPLPRKAMHAAVWLKNRYPDRARIRSTLDRELQAHVEQVFAAARAGLGSKGIYNGSAVLVEHATREVRALEGNFDFWDEAHGGELAGFAIRRSTGSALKPFIYAAAIDRGLALPEHLVPDVPLHFGSFAPKNFDESYAGLVRLEDALSQSLNVPFVALLRDVGVERFLGTLRALGATELEAEPGKLGLSAAIGGLELTPLELASFYSALAEDGRAGPLIFTADEAAARRDALQVISSGAAFLTRRALSKRDRPDLPARLRAMSASALRSIHWKTGTSYGLRDAWAAGSGPEFTAVVWTGNFDRRPSAELIGAEAAAPLFFDLLEGIERRTRLADELAPAELASIEVCAYSGHLATPACPETKRVLALRKSVPTKPCPFHVHLDVDLDRGFALAPSCRGDRRWETRSFLVWPASVRRFLGDQDRTLPFAPAPAPECAANAQASRLSILSPPPGRLLVIPGVPEDRQQVPLEADAIGPAGRLSWFVDGRFLGAASSADERLWWSPSAGAHEVAVVDQTGTAARRTIEVIAASTTHM